MAAADVIRKALIEEDQIVTEEVVKYTSFKYLGSTNDVDLYVHTGKRYVETKIRNNILSIKDAIAEIEGKKVRDVYINNVKVELELKELSSKKNSIGLIDLDSLSLDKTNEMSGENDIVDGIFAYESSVLTKSKINLYLYNVALNKEWKKEVNASVIKNKLSIKRKSLYSEIKTLLDVKYEPYNNDTKEVIELLGLK